MLPYMHMPRSIVNRANVILKQLEDDNAGVGGAGKPNVQHIDEPKDGVHACVPRHSICLTEP